MTSELGISPTERNHALEKAPFTGTFLDSEMRKDPEKWTAKLSEIRTSVNEQLVDSIGPNWFQFATINSKTRDVAITGKNADERLEEIQRDLVGIGFELGKEDYARLLLPEIVSVIRQDPVLSDTEIDSLTKMTRKMIFSGIEVKRQQNPSQPTR